MLSFSRFLTATLLILATGAAHALDVRNARTPESPAGAPVMAGYLELHNYTDTTITLTGASSPAFDRIEIHRTIQENDSTRMERMEEIEVRSGQQEYLVPRGLHLMMFSPDEAYSVGDHITVELETTNGTIEVEMNVINPMMIDHNDAEHHSD